MRLYHYTCDHGRAGILRDMTLRAPSGVYRGLLWLTDQPVPDIEGLGLTSYMLRCNRTAYRVTVESDRPVPWIEWAHDQRVPLRIRLGLDGANGARPLSWWVSDAPLPVLAVEPTWVKT